MSVSNVLSMTGFGSGQATLREGRIKVELRAVNHRHLDVRVRAAAELADASGVVEDAIRAAAVRGRIEATVRWEAASSGGSLDLGRMRRVYAELLNVRDELAPGEPVSITALLSLPGVWSGAARLEASEVEGPVREATTQALQELTAMRAREGQALAADLTARLATLRSHAEWIEAQRPAVLDAARQRLVARVEKLLEGTAIELDGARVTQEVAWFAERSDVAEELTRLASHLSEFSRSLRSGGETVGKRLDFLVQEMGREVNTLGSKANDAGIAHKVVDMKAELERVREQIQNIL